MRGTESLDVRTVRSLPEIRALAADWADLWLRCREATIFQSPEWLLPWLEVFQPQHLYVIEVRRAMKLVGLAPMFAYRCAEQHVLALAGAGISDYLDWLIDSHDESQIARTILTHLEEETGWDSMELTDLPATSALLRTLPSDPALPRVIQAACPVLRLPATLQDLSKVVPRPQLGVLRAARKRICRAGKVWVEIATQATLDEFLDALLRLHRLRWSGKGLPGVLSDTRVQAFHRSAARGLLSRGALRFYALRFEGAFIACLYALVEQHVLRCYLQGFDPAYAAFSPGVNILGAVLEDAVRLGIRCADFLRGRENYKYDWGATDQVTYHVSLTRATCPVVSSAA